MSVPRTLRRLVRFGLVGLANTAFGYSIYFGIVWIGSPPEIALLIATIAGVVFNFFTTGRMVFNSQDNRLFFRFVMAYASVFLVNVGLLRATIAAGVGPLWAQAALIPFVTLISFGIMQTCVFRKINQ